MLSLPDIADEAADFVLEFLDSFDVMRSTSVSRKEAHARMTERCAAMSEVMLSPRGDRRLLGMSRRAAACGRAQLRALILGGAVWGNCRENANCGDPPG